MILIYGKIHAILIIVNKRARSVFPAGRDRHPHYLKQDANPPPLFPLCPSPVQVLSILPPYVLEREGTQQTPPDTGQGRVSLQ